MRNMQNVFSQKQPCNKIIIIKIRYKCTIQFLYSVCIYWFVFVCMLVFVLLLVFIKFSVTFRTTIQNIMLDHKQNIEKNGKEPQSKFCKITKN